MKSIILTSFFMFSSFVLAESKKSEKTLELYAHVVSMSLASNGLYRLELREYAAAYHAEEKFVPCLQKAIKENKTTTLKVSAYSLLVQECRVD